MKTLGAREVISLPVLGIDKIDARVDTGAKSSSIHVEKIEEQEKNGVRYISFVVPAARNRRFETDEFTVKRVKSSNGEIQRRYAVKITVELYGERYKTDFTLASRHNMKFPVLLGRRILKNNFIVDVSKFNLSLQNK